MVILNVSRSYIEKLCEVAMNIWLFWETAKSIAFWANRKGRTKDKRKTITYKFNSTTVSKYVSELKSTIKKAYINAGKTTEQFDNDIQSLIRVIRVSSKDSKYTIQTRYIYKYKKARVRQNKDNTDCIKTSKYVFIMIFSSWNYRFY